MNVTLKQPHTHAGKPCQPGDAIDVSPEQAKWLAEQGVIEAPEQSSTAAGKSK